MINTRKIKGKWIFLIIILAVVAIGANLFRLHYVRTVVEHGKIAYDQEDYDLAISAYTRANKLIFWDKEQKASNLLWRGRAYYGKEDFDMAISDFTKAIELRPNDFVYYLWRGRAYQEKKGYVGAIADFIEAIKLDSDSHYGEYDKFNVKQKLEETREKKYATMLLAIDNYTEAIRLNPNNADAYFKRGYAYAYGNIAGQLSEIKEAIYSAFMQTEKWDGAISDWERALKINPNHADAKKYLELARQMRGY
jgi:tetratricopeptide (TPR) repeat protein